MLFGGRSPAPFALNFHLFQYFKNFLIFFKKGVDFSPAFL